MFLMSQFTSFYIVYSLTNYFSSYFFLNFCPLTFIIHGWLFKTVFSSGSQTAAESGYSWFTGHCRVHSWDWGLYASSQVPLHMRLVSTAPIKALFSTNGCQIIAGVGGAVRDILFGHLAGITPYVAIMDILDIICGNSGNQILAPPQGLLLWFVVVCLDFSELTS